MRYPQKIFYFLLIFFQLAYGQNKDSSSSKIDYTKLGIISGVTLGGFIYGHSLQSRIWWNGESSDFHFNWSNDWKYALGSDKFGHFYFPYLVTNLYSQAFEWSGIEKEKSLIYAGSLAFFYQTYIEIFDGFNKEIGFSWGDFAANALGSIYPYLQEKNSYLKIFNFKISYEASERFKRGSHSVIIDDYESTYNWLSINIHQLLPENLKEHYPSFINLALGHSVKNLNSGGNHELFISLDWNLEALPGDFWLLKLLKKNLNFYHLPAPAVKVYPNMVWYGLKF